MNRAALLLCVILCLDGFRSCPILYLLSCIGSFLSVWKSEWCYCRCAVKVTFPRGRITQEGLTWTALSYPYSPGWSSALTAAQFQPHRAKPAWGTKTELGGNGGRVFNQNAFVNSVTPAAGSSVCQVSFLIYGKNIPAVFPLAAWDPSRHVSRTVRQRLNTSRLIQGWVLFKFHTRGSLTAFVFCGSDIFWHCKPWWSVSFWRRRCRKYPAESNETNEFRVRLRWAQRNSLCFRFRCGFSVRVLAAHWEVEARKTFLTFLDVTDSVSKCHV